MKLMIQSIISISIFLILLFSLSGCQNPDNEVNNIINMNQENKDILDVLKKSTNDTYSNKSEIIEINYNKEEVILQSTINEKYIFLQIIILILNAILKKHIKMTLTFCLNLIKTLTL